jgi:porphobilinogen synthase
MSVEIINPTVRLRRLRQHDNLRAMVQEHRVTCDDLILPLFIKAGLSVKQPIASMPGHYQLSLQDLDAEIASIVQLGIPAVMLFGIPEHKDAIGSAALLDQGIVQQAIRRIKQCAPTLLVISDLCFCEYTDHGHCGVLQQNTAGTVVDNDATLPLLAEQAVSHAQAGADIIAPSGMMDGMVAAIRQGLDQAGFQQTAILSYAVKYASSFYGPFRDAAEGAPQQGDRRGYQMNPANAAIGMREAEQDMLEGADMLMVKPGMPYLDMVHRLKQRFIGVPLVVYQVSGEFAMIKAAAAQGCLDEGLAIMESAMSMKRAGADMMISYFAKDIAKLLGAIK